MKAYWGNGGIASRILDLGTRWRLVVSFTSRPLYPQGKSPWCPLDRRLGGPGGEKVFIIAVNIKLIRECRSYIS
jgi:hypothetical protein